MELLNTVRGLFNQALRAEDGVTAIEYAMIAALVALLLVTSLGALETKIAATFTALAGAI